MSKSQEKREVIQRGEDCTDEATSVYSRLRAELAKLRAENQRLKKIIRDVYADLIEVPELNMSNFNNDDVDALNAGVITAFQNLDAAMCKFTEETDVVI